MNTWVNGWMGENKGWMCRCGWMYRWRDKHMDRVRWIGRLIDRQIELNITKFCSLVLQSRISFCVAKKNDKVQT